MGKYYYFVAQLPFLQFKKKPPLERKTFLEEAKKWLTHKHYCYLVQSSIAAYSREGKFLPAMVDYLEFEKTLRQELAEFRKIRKENPSYAGKGWVQEISSLNPLQAEIKLLSFRWHYLEDKQKNYYFDINFIIIYYLKLQILERLFSFNKEEGLKRFNLLCRLPS